MRFSEENVPVDIVQARHLWLIFMLMYAREVHQHISY